MFVHTPTCLAAIRLANNLELVLGYHCFLRSRGLLIKDEEIKIILDNQPISLPVSTEPKRVELKENPQHYVVPDSTLSYGEELLGAETLKYPDGKHRDVAVLIHATPPRSAFERWWREWRTTAQVIVG